MNFIYSDEVMSSGMSYTPECGAFIFVKKSMIYNVMLMFVFNNVKVIIVGVLTVLYLN